MKLCGFLSPDGIYTPCEPYEHMDTAIEIVQKSHHCEFRKDFRNRLDAEFYLQKIGYVVFYARCVHKRFVVDGKITPLTRVQEDFLVLHMVDANNEEQKWDMDRILRQNDDFKEYSAMNYVSEKFMKR